MQQLTPEQIQIIEKALIEKCNFEDFDDVRLEIIDHIASEIEGDMENSKVLFDTAFVKVMTRWNPIILPKSWSRYETVPYIVCKLWKSLDWQIQFTAIIVSVLMTYFSFLLEEKDFSAHLTLFPILLAGIISNIYLLYRKYIIKVHSTLSSYALHKIFKLSLLMLLFICLNIAMFNSETKNSLQPHSFLTIYFSLLMIGRAWLMHKHLKIENQLLKVI